VPAVGGVPGGRVQVGTLGLQPPCRLRGGGQRRRAGRRPGRRQRAAAAHPRRDVAAGGQRRLLVVVEQPPGRGGGIGRIVFGGEGAGMLAEQGVEPVPSRDRLGDQMMVVKSLEVAASLPGAGVIERGGGVGVDVGAGIQAQPAE